MIVKEKYRRQLPKESQGIKIVVEDMDSSIRERRDIRDIVGRKVNDKTI